MTKKLKNVLSLLLALSMVLSMLCVTAFADDGDTADSMAVVVKEDGGAAGISDTDEVGEKVDLVDTNETVDLEVAVDSEETALMTVSAASAQYDPTLSPVLKVKVTPAADYSNVEVGDTIKWDVTITNNSDTYCDATYVAVCLYEDNDIAKTIYFDDLTAYDENGNAIYIDSYWVWVGDLSGAGSTYSFTLEGKIPESAAGKSLTGVAYGCYFDSDDVFWNCGYTSDSTTGPMQVTAPAQYDPELSPILKVKVTPDADYSNVKVGDTIKWDVTITNNSNSYCKSTWIEPLITEGEGVKTTFSKFDVADIKAYDADGKDLYMSGNYIWAGDLSGAGSSYTFTLELTIPESLAGKTVKPVVRPCYRDGADGNGAFHQGGYTASDFIDMTVADVVKGVARIEETGEVYETLQAALDATKKDQSAKGTTATITLLNDTTETVKASYTGGTTYHLTLDLNGHTITGKGDGPVITYWPGSTKGSYKFSLTINDSVGTGTITGGNATYGGAVYVRSGGSGVTVTINGGNFTGNTATHGGVVSFYYQDGGTLVVNGGTFTDNTAASNGGVIYARTVTVNGGTFTNNTADKGGAIYVVGGGCTADLAIDNAKIFGNSAVTYGDDIVFGLTGNYTRATTLTLMDASDMGVPGVESWVVDGYYLTDETASRADTNANSFTDDQWPNTSKTGKATIALKAGKVAEIPEYIVTFNANATFCDIVAPDGTKVSSGSYPNENTYTMTVKSGKTIEELPTATRNATYRFGGWFTADGEEFTSATVVTGDVTVYAKWVQTYTVRFAKDSKTGLTFDSIVVDTGKAADLTAINAQIKEAGKALGYEFMGWADNSMVTGEIVAVDSYTGNKTITLKAVWQILPTEPTFTAGTQILLKVYDENGVSQGNYGFWDDVNYDFYSVGEVDANDGTNPNAPAKDYPYQCTLTLNVARMLLGYSNKHELTSDPSVEITLYLSSTGRWAALPDGGYSYTVQHTAYVHHTAADAVEKNVVPATCTENGSHDLVEYCSVCNNEMSRETVTDKALGHDWVEGDVTTVPDCENAGVQVLNCSRCDATDTKALSATGHTAADAKEENRIEPTCTAEGSYDLVVRCAKCDTILSSEHMTIDMLAHTPEVIPAVAPTYGSTGLTEGSKCSECGVILVPQTILPRRIRPTTTAPSGSDVEIDEPDVPLAEVPLPFVDVAEDSKYHDAVAYVYVNDLMDGVEETIFAPDTLGNRATVAMALYQLEKAPTVEFTGAFSDVEDGMWYTSAIEWGTANGLIKGYGNGKFGALDQVTREQLATFLFRYAQFKGYDVSASGSLSEFTDGDQVSAWAKDAMSWAVAVELFQADDNGCINSTAAVSRADIAMILMQFGENVAK